MIELVEIQVFLVLCEELHFGRTAARLSLSQARVSQIVATLERRVGGRLFDRNSREVRRTPLGDQLRRAVAEPYRALLDGVDDVRAHATAAERRLTIGAASTLMGTAVVTLTKAGAEIVPPITISTVELPPTGDIYTHLRTGSVDALIMWRTRSLPAEFTAGPVIVRAERVAAVAADDPLAHRTTIAVGDTDRWTVNRLAPPGFNDILLPDGTPSTTFAAHGIADTLAQVALGGIVYPTVAPVRAHASGLDVAIVPIRDLPPLDAVLLTRTADQRPVVQDLLALARKHEPPA